MKKLVISLLFMVLGSCGSTNTEYTYPKSREDEEIERIGSLFKQSDKDNNLFHLNINNSNKILSNSVNDIAWKASLETIKFIPLLSSDSVGGIIITDWYQEISNPYERYKLTIIVTGPQLNASSVKVMVHKQMKKGSEWLSVEADPETANEIEEKIMKTAKNIKMNKMILNK